MSFEQINLFLPQLLAVSLGLISAPFEEVKTQNHKILFSTLFFPDHFSREVISI